MSFIENIKCQINEAKLSGEHDWVDGVGLSAVQAEKLLAVVEAAQQIMKHDYAFSTIDSYGDQLIRRLEAALAGLEKQ